MRNQKACPCGPRRDNRVAPPTARGARVEKSERGRRAEQQKGVEAPIDRVAKAGLLGLKARPEVENCSSTPLASAMASCSQNCSQPNRRSREDRPCVGEGSISAGASRGASGGRRRLARKRASRRARDRARSTRRRSGRAGDAPRAAPPRRVSPAEAEREPPAGPDRSASGGSARSKRAGESRRHASGAPLK